MKRTIIAAVCVLCAFVATDSYAQADIGFKGAGARLSFVSPDGPDGAVGFGGIVDLGNFTPDIGFQATVDYWSSGQDVGLAKWDWSDLSFGARAVYEFGVSNPQVKPYAAGGLALHRFSFSYDQEPIVVGGITVAGGSFDDSEIKIGVDLAGGVAFEANENFDILGELMYRIVSDVGQFVISGGFVYWFGS